MEILKHLFTSKARIKLLKTFLLIPEKEYFVRELTRKLNEQINSVRRELDNLKQLGLLKSRSKNRKKYYLIDKNFVFYNELRNIIIKAVNAHENIIKKIQSFGKIEFLIISGQLVNKEAQTDLLIVGSLNRNTLEDFLTNELETKQPIRFSILEREDFLYRVRCKDKFIYDLLNDKENIIGINKLDITAK